MDRLNLITNIIKTPFKFLHAGKDIVEGVKSVQTLDNAKVIFFYNNERFRTLPVRIFEDMRWFQPKGIKRRFGFNKLYTDDSDGCPTILCSIDNPFSLNLKEKPEEDYTLYNLVDTKEELEKLKEFEEHYEPINMKDYFVTGGKEMSWMAELMVTSALLGILAPRSAKEFLYVGLLAWFLGFIMFFPLGIIFAVIIF